MNKNVQKKPMTKAQRAALKKKKRTRTIILIVIELIVIAVLLFVFLAFFWGYSKVDRIEKNDIKPEDVEINEDISSETIEVMDNFQTIALFGLDNRSNGNLSSGNSDVIMIVTINNETKEVKICSVYRDSYLDCGGGKFKKCNAAYHDGGAEQAISMLNTNLDLNITEYVTVDFNAVVECVDLLGGVEMTVTEDESILMWGYMDEINKMTKRNSPYLPGAGTYTLDGVQACAYARIRQTIGDDYKRTERQRAVIAAMVEKAQRSDLVTINKVIDAVFDEIQTSLTNQEMISLASQIFNYKLGEMSGFPFKKNSLRLGSKGDVVAPCTLETNVKELHEFLYNNTEYTPSSTVIANSKKIVQDTGFDEGDGF